jgi:integrase
VGAANDVNTITGQVLFDYHGSLLELITGGLSAASAQHKLTGVKQFVKWCYQTDSLDKLPRNFDSADLRITVEVKTISTLDVAEYRKLFDGTAERTKLYFLLMLNCGFTQVDIADLLKDEVDLKAGVITRKRSKTASHENVPEVKYKLWPLTLALLDKFQSNDATLFLTNDNGSPLKTESIEGGKYKKADNIRSAYSRVCTRLKIPARPLKLIRKTGASAIGDNPEFADLAELYLGHAPRTIAQRHYVKPSMNRLADATDYLAELFDIATLP